MADKVIKVGKHKYNVGVMDTRHSGKYYTVNKQGSMSVNTFRSKADIIHHYPNLKGKIGKV